MQNISNLIFDYGNVIFEIDFEKAQKAFRNLGLENVEELYGHRGQDRLFDDFDKGLISSADFRDGIRGLIGNATLSDEAIDGAWNALLIGVPQGTHELLLACKEKYRTFLLSNNNDIHYTWILEHLREQYGINDNEALFEKTYYSHFVGLRKPAKEIFELVLKENHLNPEETLFIDDSPQHLESAKKLGLQTALCPTPKELRELLNSYQLLTQ
jgi:FMN phosphatase YigB (HAD superfamily)